MNPEFINRRQVSAVESPEFPTVTLSFEKLSDGPQRIKSHMCNGESHWNVIFQEDADGEIVMDNIGSKSPCNCPDKNNRLDAYSIFKT